MDFIFSRNKRSKFTEDLPEPKRISTPAGLRLSTILENGDQAKGPSKLKRLSFNKQPVLVEDPNETPGAVEANSLAPPPPAQGYTYSIFSDKSATVVSGPIRPERVDKDNFITRRGGWRRLALIVGLVLLVILALGVGLGVGLKHRHHSQNLSSSADSDNGSSSNKPSATGGATPSPTSNPNASFPIGNWSMVTFLNTVYTNCTSNAAAWNCYPYTVYSDNPTQSQTTFNWMVTAGSTKGTYEISSAMNPFLLDFKSTPMVLKDEGNSTEHYWFQVTVDKTVTPLHAISSDNSQSVCYYNGTSFTGYLYTKIASDNPQASPTNGTWPSWPYAVRAEQTMSGGSGVPTCYETNNGALGQEIQINSTDFGELCDCLYINYLTPIPNT